MSLMSENKFQQRQGSRWDFFELILLLLQWSIQAKKKSNQIRLPVAKCCSTTGHIAQGILLLEAKRQERILTSSHAKLMGVTQETKFSLEVYDALFWWPSLQGYLKFWTQVSLSSASFLIKVTTPILTALSWWQKISTHCIYSWCIITICNNYLAINPFTHLLSSWWICQ